MKKISSKFNSCIIAIAALLLVSCSEENKSFRLPSGFEIVSRDGNSFFVWVDEKSRGDKMLQRMTGKKICDTLINIKDYCEVYYFANKSDIPTQFPIINRVDSMGYYEKKYGAREMVYLPAPQNEDDDTRVVVFLKDIYRKVTKASN